MFEFNFETHTFPQKAETTKILQGLITGKQKTGWEGVIINLC